MHAKFVIAAEMEGCLIIVMVLFQLFMIEPLRRGILLVDGAADNIEEELLSDEKPESEVGVVPLSGVAVCGILHGVLTFVEIRTPQNQIYL